MASNLKSSLLPAVRPGISKEYLTELPSYNIVQWTFGRGSVIWQIWPAVLLHTVFAFVVVHLWVQWEDSPELPDVMLTVLGVVIGFVISYRAMSGYERYWQGRTAWMDIIKNARMMSRLVWIHVPPVLTPKTHEEVETRQFKRSASELMKVMSEKRMAMDLIKGFCFALKHHMRGELGIHYEDLYDLVKPLHDHDHQALQDEITRYRNGYSRQNSQSNLGKSSVPSLRRQASTASISGTSPKDTALPSRSTTPTGENHTGSRHRERRGSPPADERQPLLPAENPRDNSTMDKVQTNLIPFASIFSKIGSLFKRNKNQPDMPPSLQQATRKWAGPVQPKVGIPKGAPRTGGSGENLPVEILRCFSEWISVLEDRGTVPGGSLGGLHGCIGVFESSLTNLECILTTPLPFVYSAHIRQTVWIYLFLLPFQLVDNFGYHTIPATMVAAFIYLGFCAAGDEIEQPFGYDENDLDLDLFCREIIADEIDNLIRSPSVNAYVGGSRHMLRSLRSTQSLVDLTEVDSMHFSDATL